MSVLDDIRDGKGLKPITFNCFTCQNDNCIASGAKTATYQCPDYKHKKTNADRIRSMTDEELAKKISGIESFAITCGSPWSPVKWLDWLKQEADND